MSAFRGRYEHQLDEKGRVSLPAAFRRREGEDRFVLLQWEKPYLTLFPEAKWEEIEGRLSEYKKAGPQAMNHVRVLYAGLVEVTPDKQGRILIPSPLQRSAGLSASVILLGTNDRVELWDPATYERVVLGGAGDFDQFAYKLFG